MGNPLLQIRRLNVTYLPTHGRAVQAVDFLDLDVVRSEVVGILGESGSGKSTLAWCLLHLLPKDTDVTGSILFDGEDLIAASDRSLQKTRGARLALIPQDPAVCLNPVIRVGQQISDVLRAHLSLSPKERQERVRELLKEVGFDDIERIHRSYPHQLSGGQRQRIVIAQAIACRPDLIIADEPTSKLDPQLQTQIIDLMSRIVTRYETALIWITHEPARLDGFADRVAVIYAGRIIEDGPADVVLRNPFHPYTRALVGLAHLAGQTSRGPAGGLRVRHRLPEIPGDPPDVTGAAKGCRFAPRCSEKLRHCSIRDPGVFSVLPSHVVSCFKYEN